jgi:Thiolase-like protein type 1 additional C-terminal domain
VPGSAGSRGAGWRQRRDHEQVFLRGLFDRTGGLVGQPKFGVLDAFDGEAVAESFTIQPGKAGETATVVARVLRPFDGLRAQDEREARVLANSADPAICAALRQGKVAGRPVRIEEAGEGVNRFWFL